MQQDGLLPIGRIVGLHGLKGDLKVHSYAESHTVFHPGEVVSVRDRGNRLLTYSVLRARPHKRIVLLSLEGVNTLDMAEQLIGSELLIERAPLPELEEGTYYWDDMIGLTVLTIDGEDLGKVKAIIETGSNDVFVVESDDKETLVPALESVVLEIDPKNGTMRVDLPEGL